RSFAFAGRARAEQNQTGRAALPELPQERMTHGTVKARNLPGSVRLEGDGELDLCELHEHGLAVRSGGAQWNDDVAVEQGGDKRCADIGRVVAAYRQCVSRFDPLLRQSGEPGVAALGKRGKRQGLFT